MDPIRWCISRPVSVSVGVLLIVMFGSLALREIPVQLTPTVDTPVVTITTQWPGRSPQEIVDEITKEQEEQLKNVDSLKSMRSISRTGASEITLEFYVGTDIDAARQDVSDRLRQVSEYPEDVDEPVVEAAEGGVDNAIAWLIIDVDRTKVPPDLRDYDISQIADDIEDEIKPYLERIDGVARVDVFGGRPRELQVLLDPERLAARQLSHEEVVRALRNENENISAGTIDEGKRRVRVRVIGQFQNERQVLDTVVAYRDGRPVFVKDIGTVELDFAKRRGFVRSLGQPSIAMPVIRQTGANVVDIMDELRVRLDEVRADILPTLDPDVGAALRLRQVYDETIYIDSSINLVSQNIVVGGLLAAGVLIIFLRSFVTTGVIALAIPIAVIATFLVMFAAGRSLNVISLAGLAFAVGMVVDNAIVVLENIYRRLQEGDPPRTAAYEGAREVWGAVLASTLTTVAVFIPVLTIQEEAGQLFRDISLAIVAAVTLSLLISITVIPTACAAWLRVRPERTGPVARARRAFDSLFGLAPLLGRLSEHFETVIAWCMRSWRGWTIRPLVIIIMTAASVFGAVSLMPPLDYLPAGNRNLVFGGLLIPPGYSIDQMTEIAESIESGVRPYLEVDADDQQAVAQLNPIRRSRGGNNGSVPPFDPVPVENFFIGSFNGGMFVGATSEWPEVVIPVGQLLTNSMSSVPDAFGGASQSSLFGRGIGGGNSIDVEISGPRLDRVLRAADAAFFASADLYDFPNVTPSPGNFNLQQQEWQLRVNDVGRELGVRTTDVGTAARALFDGAFIGDFRYQGETIDFILLPAGGRLDFKEKLLDTPVMTPAGRRVPLDTIVDIVPALAPQEIQRIEELESVTIQIKPPEDQPLEATMQQIRDEIIQPLRDQGLIDPSMRVRLEGTAAQLDEVRAALFGQPQETPASRTTLALWIAGILMGVGLILAGYASFRAVLKNQPLFGYGAAGAAILFAILAGIAFIALTQPQLGTARFIWALAVTYLLMSALFESYIYPFVIMFTVPLAVVGGFAGLKIVHDRTMADPTIAPQQLDVLTMLGFVILIGVVVNNAILIVHQALNFMRTDPDLGSHAAVARSVRTRIRPIFMSVLTSVGGMLPLVVFPGAGSEMYRGLGSVVIGGLLVSTVFTILLVPLMFSLVMDMRTGLAGALFGTPLPAASTASRPAEPETSAKRSTPSESTEPSAQTDH